MIATITTTIMIPTQNPALKIPAMASQLLKVRIKNKEVSTRLEILNFIIHEGFKI